MKLVLLGFLVALVSAAGNDPREEFGGAGTGSLIAATDPQRPVLLPEAAANGGFGTRPLKRPASPLKCEQLAVCRAVYLGETAKLAEHLATGANANEPSLDRGAPLYVAAQEGRVAAAALLLKAKADVNVQHRCVKAPPCTLPPCPPRSPQLCDRARDGETPLHAAARNELQHVTAAAKMTALLLEAGATRGTVDKGGKTALDKAGCAECAALIRAKTTSEIKELNNELR